MNDSSHDLVDQIAKLLQQKELGEWTQVQQDQLATILKSSSNARRIYLKLTHDNMSFHWLVHERGEAMIKNVKELSTPKVVKPLSNKHSKNKSWFQSASLAWAAALLMALGLALLLFKRHQDNLDPIDTTSIAVLTRTVDAIWDDMNTPLNQNAPLQPSLLKLKSGLAQIDFYCGASLVIEGPAELDLISSEKTFLNFGKLRSYVPEHARGFTVKLKDTDIIDLGTEFALQVDPDGNSEVHVINGKVKLKAGDTDELLEGGQALSLHSPGSHLEIEVNEEAFVDFESLYHLSHQQHRHRFNKWNEYSKDLSNDQDALLYFSFEGQNSWDRELINLAPNIGNGAIVGCRWSEGRWPGKKALEFNGFADRVRVNVPGEFTQLTFAAWVRFYKLKNKLNALLLTDSWSHGKTHWQVSRHTKLVMGVRGHGGDYVTKESATSGNRDNPWVFLTSIYDLKSKTLKHYINAKLKYKKPLRQIDVVTIGSASLGNWMNPEGKLISNRNFNGRIDEFMVLKRALNEKEVKKMYQVGKLD